MHSSAVITMSAGERSSGSMHDSEHEKAYYKQRYELSAQMRITKASYCTVE